MLDIVRTAVTDDLQGARPADAGTLSEIKDSVSYTIGPCTVDTSMYEIWRDGVSVPVEPQVFELLVLLLRNRDRVVTKDEIIRDVWRGRCVSDGAISTRIMAVRQALGDNGAAQSLIRTVRGRGFRIVGDVSENVARAPAPTSAPRIERKKVPSIAILPFAISSSEPEQVAFGDSITEDLITELGRFRSLAVAARTSSFAYRERIVDVRKIGRDLGVDYVLEGSVRKLGRRVRVTVQLADTTTGHHLWAERYDRSCEQIFDVHDELTNTIVATLSGHIASATLAQARSRPHGDWRACDLNFMARKYSQLARTATNVDVVLEYAQRAVDVDPAYAPGHSMLANALRWRSVLVSLGDTNRVQNDYRCARESALNAVKLDSNEAEALRSLGWSHMCHRDYADAERVLGRSYALNPHNCDVAMSWVTALTYLGRPEEAIVLGERTMQRLPQHPDYCLFDLGEAHFFAGQYAQAVEQFERSPEDELDESTVVVIAAYVHAGAMEGARRHAARYRRELVRSWKGDPSASLAERIAWEFSYRHFYKRPQDIERIRHGLHAAGLS